MLAKKLYGQYGKYSVYLVDADKVRNESLHKEEFGEYGTNLLYSFIPHNEIWLDKNLSEQDKAAVLTNALTQLKDRDAGINKSKAYLNGIKAEKSEREKLSGKHLVKKPHLPINPPQNVYIKLLTVISPPKDNKDEAVQVWLINSNYVRNLYQTTFTEGSNGYAEPGFIPANEIWIDNTVSPTERPYILIHEFTERYLMKFKHYPYDKAHPIASKVEFHWRNKGIQFPTLINELSIEWVKSQIKLY